MTLLLTQPIQSLSSVENAMRYLSNRNCASHRDYVIWSPPGQNRLSAEHFLSTLCWGFGLVARETKLVRPADWIIASFRDESHLSDDECTHFGAKLRQKLCPDEFSHLMWHRHLKNGRADGNLILPRIKMVNGVPLLRRKFGRPLLAIAMEATTEAIRTANLGRTLTARIVEPSVARVEALIAAGLEPLSFRLARVSMTMGKPLVRENLATMLVLAGFTRGDFELSPGILIIKTKKRRHVNVDKLLSDADALLKWEHLWLRLRAFCDADEPTLHAKDETDFTENNNPTTSHENTILPL